MKAVSKVLSQSRAVEADVICKSPFAIDSNTLAYYTFQEKDDSILDYSGYNNIAEVKGSVPVVTGICRARYFDGNASDYITVKDYNSPNPADNTLRIPGKNMTVEAWVKWNGHNGGWQRIVGKGDPTNRNYGLWMNPSQWLFQIYSGTGIYCDALYNNTFDNHWHYMAGTYDGSNIRLYVDGKKVAESACNISPATSSDPLTIGYSVGYPAGHDPFSGIIDEVTVSRATKSNADIQARFDQGQIFHLP
jgi:beta-galactosidase